MNLKNLLSTYIRAARLLGSSPSLIIISSVYTFMMLVVLSLMTQWYLEANIDTDLLRTIVILAAALVTLFWLMGASACITELRNSQSLARLALFFGAHFAYGTTSFFSAAVLMPGYVSGFGLDNLAAQGAESFWEIFIGACVVYLNAAYFVIMAMFTVVDTNITVEGWFKLLLVWQIGIFLFATVYKIATVLQSASDKQAKQDNQQLTAEIAELKSELQQVSKMLDSFTSVQQKTPALHPMKTTLTQPKTNWLSRLINKFSNN